MDAIIVGVGGLVAGALAVVLGYLSYRLCVWVKTAVSDLCKGFSNVGKLAEQNEKLVQMAQMVGTELQMLRSAISAQAPGGGEAPTEEIRSTLKPGPRPPFPTMTTALYESPDAKEEELIVDETDDARMATLERIEELRMQGYESDPAELEG